MTNNMLLAMLLVQKKRPITYKSVKVVTQTGKETEVRLYISKVVVMVVMMSLHSPIIHQSNSRNFFHLSLYSSTLVMSFDKINKKYTCYSDFINYQ